MSAEPRYLDGKVALVTGVTSGLGKHVARVFAARGAAVVGVARRAEVGEKLAAEISAHGDSFHFVAADVAQEQDCQRALAETIERFGRIDILINNAAISGGVVPTHEATTGLWDEVFALNLRGAFVLCREALRHMRAQKSGVILNIASISGIMGIANSAAYCASKAGLIHFTNTLAVECAETGVRANAILIGAVPSAMSYGTAAEMGQVLRGPDWQPSKDYRTKFGMRANPADMVARALSLLCMDDAQTITGAVIPIDGGVTAGLLGSQMNYLTCAQQLPES